MFKHKFYSNQKSITKKILRGILPMIKNIYKQSLNVLAKMPFKLWGLSLLTVLLNFLIMVFAIFPIITIPLILTLNAGMSIVFLDGYRGQEANSDNLFSGFKNFWRTAGGMCWQNLWLLLWMIIPIAGPFIAIVKSYSYSFTPYLLVKDENVTATSALRKSMQLTKGYKLQIFLATLVPQLAIFVGMFILALLSAVPIVGVLFSLVLAVVTLVYLLFSQLFFGLVQAGFYDAISQGHTHCNHTEPLPPVIPTAPENTDTVHCHLCGTENPNNTRFCYKCGSKLD